MALPPDWSTFKPAAVASGWLVAMAPLRAMTTERVECVLGAGRSPGSWGRREIENATAAAVSHRI
jgi:hypothetical protein